MITLPVCTACLAGDCRVCSGFLRRDRHDPCECPCPDVEVRV